MSKPFRVIVVTTGRCHVYRDYASYAYWWARGDGILAWLRRKG